MIKRVKELNAMFLFSDEDDDCSGTFILQEKQCKVSKKEKKNKTVTNI